MKIVNQELRNIVLEIYAYFKSLIDIGEIEDAIISDVTSNEVGMIFVNFEIHPPEKTNEIMEKLNIAEFGFSNLGSYTTLEEALKFITILFDEDDGVRCYLPIVNRILANYQLDIPVENSYDRLKRLIEQDYLDNPDYIDTNVHYECLYLIHIYCPIIKQ